MLRISETARSALTYWRTSMMKQTGQKRNYSAVRSPRRKSTSNKHIKPTITQPSRSQSSSASPRPAESVTVITPAVKQSAKQAVFTHLTEDGILQTVEADPQAKHNHLLDELIRTAPHSVISVLTIMHKTEPVGVVIASAAQGLVIDLSDSVYPQSLFELFAEVQTPKQPSSQHSSPPHSAPTSVPNNAAATALKLIPDVKHKKRLRKIIRTNYRQGEQSELHLSLVCLSERLELITPITDNEKRSKKESQDPFTVASLQQLSSPEHCRLMISRAQSVVADYIKNADVASRIHQFLEADLARLPEFHFDMAPLLPKLGPVSRHDLAEVSRQYHRFNLPPALPASLPLLKLSASHKVRIAYAHSGSTLEEAVQSFKASCTDSRVIGFDTESRSTFRAGAPNHPVSLIQFASSSQVLLIRIDRKVNKRLPKCIEDLLLDPSYSKVGQGLDGDVGLLCTQYQLSQTARTDPLAHSFLDLAHVSSQLRFGRPGLASMVAGLLGHRLSKAQQCSNWELKQLSPAQIEYAALDAIVSKQIYHRLEALMHSFNDSVLRCADACQIPRDRFQSWLIQPIWNKPPIEKKPKQPAQHKQSAKQ